MAVGVQLGLGFWPGIGGGVAVMVLSCFMVLGLYGPIRKLHPVGPDKSDRAKLIWLIVESLMFIACLVGMVALRLTEAWNVAQDPVFEAAQVTQEPFAPSAVHGGMRIYLYLLHGVLLLLGNKPAAAELLQLILLVCAALGLYFAVRRLSGSIAALLTVAFFGFSPYMLTASRKLSPVLLFVFVYSLAVWAIASASDSPQEKDGAGKWLALALRYLAAGLLVGFCCYLDMTGITLLFFVTGVVCFEDSNPVAAFLCCILGAALGYAGFHAIHSLWSGGTFLASVCGQAELYLPGSFRIPVLVEDAGVLWDVAVLVIFLTIGIFSFWCSRKIRDRGMWLFAAILLMGMQCFGMTASEYFDGFALLFLMFAAMAGCSVEALFTPPVAAETTEEMEIVDMDAHVDRETHVDIGLPGESADAQGEETAAIHYIENPLPLPKKHERRVLDYDYEVAEDDDFDI
jgi:hypothetical protein